MIGLVDLAHVICTSLWRATWQAGVVVLIAWLLVKMTSRLPSALHCWIWRIAFVKMLLVLAFAGTIDAPLLPSRGEAPSSAALPIATDQPERDVPAVAVIPSEVLGVATQHPNHLPILIASLWAFGVVVHFGLLARCWRRARRLVRNARMMDGDAPLPLLRETARQAGLRRCPQLGVIAEGGVPLVVGALRPTVLLPERVLRRLDATQLGLLLRHEVAHIRRGDLWWNWLAALGQAAFFFHPLVWLALREWRIAQESACDEYVIGGDQQRLADYARLLVQVSVVSPSSRPFVLANGMFGAYPVIKRRIEKMQRFGNMSRRAARWGAVALALLAAFGLLPWKLVPGEPPQAESRAAADDVPPRAIARSGRYTISAVNVAQVAGGHRLAWDRSTSRNDRNRVTRTFANPDGRGGGGASAGGGAGTFTAPNLAVALNVSPLKGDFLVKLDNAEATDTAGRRYRTVDFGESFRMTVPSFEAAHPGCAGAYFKLNEKPQMFAELTGTLRLAPVKIDEATFTSHDLRAGARRDFDDRIVTLEALETREDGIDLEMSITVPGPAANAGGPRAFREFTLGLRELTKATSVVLVDGEGDVYLPRAAGGGSGGGGGAGLREATININCQFAPLPPDVSLEAVRVSIVEPSGQERRVPFRLHDVRLD